MDTPNRPTPENSTPPDEPAAATPPPAAASPTPDTTPPASPSEAADPTPDPSNPAPNLSNPATPDLNNPATADPASNLAAPATSTLGSSLAAPTSLLGAPAAATPAPNPANPAATETTPHLTNSTPNPAAPAAADPSPHLTNLTPTPADPAFADPIPYLTNPTPNPADPAANHGTPPADSMPYLGDPVPYLGAQPVANLPTSGWTPPAPAYPPPPETPQRPRPPKSTAAALLLNLTGLGLGYGYLRRNLLLIVNLAVTASLVATAFLTNGATYPWSWRGLFLGWLAIVALHTGLAAHRHPPATSRTGVIAGVAAVALVVAGYVGYGIAGDRIHTAGVDAQKAGNCATALDKFDTVTGPFELTLSENVTDAEARTVECTAYASALSAQQKGKYDPAIDEYLSFQQNYPHSVLRTFVHNNLAESYVGRAAHWQLPLTTASATDSGDMLLMVLRDFGDTPAAKRVPKTIADLYAAATAAFQPTDVCGSLPTLTYFAGLDQKVVKDIVADANTRRADALYQCGLNQMGANATDAVAKLDTFIKAYPQDTRVPQAKAAMITTQVADANSVVLPVPPPLGDNSPGNIPVTFYNDSNAVMTILVAGPTAHEIILPPCAICPATYPPGATNICPTFDGRPSLKLELAPATYYFLIVGTTNTLSNTGSITPLVDYEHTECMYIEQH